MIEASHMINNGHEEMIRVLFEKNIHKIDSSKQIDYIDKHVKKTTFDTGFRVID